jgi:hypothetical protein
VEIIILPSVDIVQPAISNGSARLMYEFSFTYAFSEIISTQRTILVHLILFNFYIELRLAVAVLVSRGARGQWSALLNWKTI